LRATQTRFFRYSAFVVAAIGLGFFYARCGFVTVLISAILTLGVWVSGIMAWSTSTAATISGLKNNVESGSALPGWGNLCAMTALVGLVSIWELISRTQECRWIDSNEAILTAILLLGLPVQALLQKKNEGKIRKPEAP
jgi:hypothetical protein